MPDLTVMEINCETQEAITRPMTEVEIEEHNQRVAQAEADRLAQQEAENARIAAKESALDKLAALGLTEEEIKALIG